MRAYDPTGKKPNYQAARRAVEDWLRARGFVESARAKGVFTKGTRRYLLTEQTVTKQVRGPNGWVDGGRPKHMVEVAEMETGLFQQG